MAGPNVFVLVGDCLRAANATSRTLPFVSGSADVAFTRCYAPSTWTLPAHATLYSQQSPMAHGVVRRGESLGAGQASLLDGARENGYLTAMFSENPTFSRRLGFDRGVDFVDDSIDRKPFPSSFSPDARVDAVDVASAVTLAREIARRPNRAANVANLIAGMVGELTPSDATAYPHGGDRVQSHLTSFARRHGDESLFCIANFLDPGERTDLSADVPTPALDDATEAVLARPETLPSLRGEIDSETKELLGQLGYR